jgi:hypothetical protein
MAHAYIIVAELIGTYACRNVGFYIYAQHFTLVNKGNAEIPSNRLCNHGNNEGNKHKTVTPQQRHRNSN